MVLTRFTFENNAPENDEDYVNDEDDDAAYNEEQVNTSVRGVAEIVFSLIILEGEVEVDFTLKDNNDNNGGGDEKYEDIDDEDD